MTRNSLKDKDLTENNMNFTLFTVPGSSYNTLTDEGYSAGIQFEVPIKHSGIQPNHATLTPSTSCG